MIAVGIFGIELQMAVISRQGLAGCIDTQGIIGIQVGVGIMCFCKIVNGIGAVDGIRVVVHLQGGVIWLSRI